MYTAKTLKVGSGYINSVAQTLEENNIHGNILYVSDENVDGLYGGIIRAQIESVGRLKTKIIDDSTIAYAMAIAGRVISTDVDCIVGLGGGKVLDVCKYAAYVSKRPAMSVPTTVANDGIASPIAVLKRQDNKPKSLGCVVPAMLLLDTDVAQKCPPQLIKAGIGDTISNYMALLDWELAVQSGKDFMNGYAYLMSKTSLDALMHTNFNSICPGFIKVLADCIVLSGMAMNFAGSSRPVSGSEHLFSHAMDYYSKTQNLHGIQVALGTVAVLKMIGRDYSDVLNYLIKFEVDINPVHLGIDEVTFIRCLQNATSMRSNRYTYLHETNLNTDRLKKLYRELVEEL